MRRFIKTTAWIAGGLALLLLVSMGAVFILGNTASGRLQIEKLVARLTAGEVQLKGLAGSLPGHLTLDELELRDAAGVWLTARNIALDWTPLSYLEGRLQIDRLHVGGIDMQRLPQSSSGSTSGRTASMPRIDVASAVLDRVDLGAQLAGTPASLTANGSAHLRSVRDMLFDASARRIDGDGGYELHLHFDETRMDAALKLHEPANGPLENILSLPGLGALQATLTLNGPRGAEQLDLSLQAGALKGQAHGSLNLHELSADLGFDFEAGAMSPRADLAWERGALSGRWRGNLKSPTAQGHLEVAKLELPGGLRTASLKADLAAEGGKAELHAWLAGVQVPGSQPRLLEGDPLKIDASMRLDDPERRLELSASHRLFSLKGQAVTAGVQSAAAEVRLSNIAPFAAYLGQDLRGSAVISAQLSGDRAATRIKLDANAALIPGTQAWAAVLGDRARVEMTGGFQGGTWSIDSAKLSGRSIVLSASGSIAGQSLNLRWNASLPDLAAVSPAFAGNLNGSGSVQGPVRALSADASLNSTLSVRGSQSGNLSAVLKVRGLPAAPNGTLVMQGALDGAPLHLNVSLERSAARALHAVIHQAAWKSARAEGDLTLATDSAQMHGQMTASVAQLQDLQRLLGMDIAGSLAGSVQLRPDGRRTRAQLKVDAKDLKLAGFTGSADLSGEGFTDAFAFKAGVQMPQFNGVALSADASGKFDLDARELSLASLQGSYAGQEIRLLQPAKIHLGDGVAVDMLKLRAQKAELDVQGQIAPALSLRVALRQVQPALVNAFVPNLLAAGEIDADADLHGSATAPVGKISVNALGIQSADDAALGLPPANIRIAAVLRGHTADIDARLDAGTASQLTALGQAPLAADGEVDMKIKGNVDIGLMNAFLEARGQHASGRLDIDATVTGAVATPQIAGTLDLKDGKINDYARGLSLTDIAARIVGNQGTLQIKSFTASAAPGTVSMSGSVGILQKDMPVDLKIVARNAQPLVSKLITANLDADLTIKGTARERLDVAGTMHLNRTLIGIPNGMPLNVAVLDVRRRGKEPTHVPNKPLIIGLDVAVRAPQNIQVEGRGLDARMRGALRISGTTDSPLVNGKFDLDRGTFSLATGRLNFTDGSVSFNGAGLQNKIDPTLDFTASATIGDTTATMHITGLADAPVFDFTSTPAKPPDEIMALLLFGAPTQQLTPLQLAQVGAALASMSGVGGSNSLNPLVKIQKSLGLDRLSIAAGTTNAQTGQDSGASIEAGRYVSKRVYIEARQSTAGTSQFGADIELTKRLKLQTRLGNGTATVQGTTPENDPGSSIGLIYRFEY
ncbi:MAG TPA: translocation/assembly module TamB domain-containing protein [Steroidobacteraceae bacterium]|jgi:translocation and assembly module TamB|nr:translocation/assembly module TamB domain-containing protein [Steroidobacteraceae bacterium]